MATAAATGTLDGDIVLVRDAAHANRLHNKFSVGKPQTGNSLMLSLVEAAWCVAGGRLAVSAGARALAAADLLARGAVAGHRLEVDYIAYCDLRERGLTVRPANEPSRFDVWPRGTTSGQPEFQVLACSDRDPATAAELLDGAHGGRVLSVVDDDGGLTHYTLANDEPVGEVKPDAVAAVSGRMLADRVVVDDPKAAATYAQSFFGRPQVGGTFLSFMEAEYLRQAGALEVDGDLSKKAHATNANFDSIFAVFRDLRTRGVVAKSGFRFGTHLRGYRNNPDDDHAEWLIHSLGQQPMPMSDLSRGVRLAHGVRKKFLIAIPTSAGVRYVHVAWFRP